MSIRVVFLDIDGVLNTQFTTEQCDGYLGIEDRFVANLRKIVDSAENTKIVLSSTWRLGYSRGGHKLEHHAEYLSEKLGKQGLSIFDKTPELTRNGNYRGTEINRWMQDHKDRNIESWVVLDDEFFYDFFEHDIQNHLVRTNFYAESGGLNEEKTQEAIMVLGLAK